MNEEQRAHIVVTSSGSAPSKSNSVPLEHSGVGRSSLVLYSPATLFSTVGFEENSLQAIHAKGEDVSVDWPATASSIYHQV